MHKKQLLVLIAPFVSCLVLSSFAKAQRGVNPQKDKLQYQSYTIRLVPLAENTYGYEVTKGRELLVLQTNNPFTQSLIGLEKKEDAYNVAMWRVRQLLQEEDQANKRKSKSEKGRKGVRMNEPIPIIVANELNIGLKH